MLDKDNDLSIADLARQNAADILKVQQQGPYLLGGHSYGGAVALEVAMVLESLGHEIGVVVVSCTKPYPHKCYICFINIFMYYCIHYVKHDLI